MPKISGSYHGITSQPQFQTYPTAGMLQVPQQPLAPPPPPPPPPSQVPTGTLPTTPTTQPTLPSIAPLGPVLPGADTITPERERLIRSVMNTYER
jgi:hypothetical protein